MRKHLRPYVERSSTILAQTTGNCGPRRDVLFTMGNATTTNSAVWCSRSQRCGALEETIPGLNLHLFFLRRLNVSPTSTAVELISCKKPESFWRKVLFSQRIA